ncbi:MAG: SusD/RagB family nutrient-binding outer membrane lipoprotein [Phycisphaerae bacterium]|nr:SusD/RagB family nutrient-binding outer membrane lipoprotein [Gemmatimonadaceae bacterium]
MGPRANPDVLEVPRRIPYASNEQSVNAASLSEAIARQGPDNYSTRMWWDQ